MDKRINDGITNLNERKKIVTENNIHILEQIKDILTIDKTDLITVRMCADYYEVGEKAIGSLIFDNKNELIENGLKIITGKETKEILVKFSKKFTNYKGYFECDGIKFANRSNTFMTKRTLLNIGMLLRDSEIAKELRQRILDIVHDAEDENGSINTIVDEIDEETKLKVDYVDAMMSGDLVKMNEINAKLFELKNKRILELEKENKHKGDIIEGLADKITLAEKRQRLNQIIRLGGASKIKDRWELLYSEFTKKYHIDLNKRMNNLVLKDKVINNNGNEIKITKKIKENKLEYVDRVLNQLSDLYELSIKIFEADVDKIIDDIKIKTNNK